MMGLLALPLLAVGALIAFTPPAYATCGSKRNKSLILGARTYRDKLLYSGNEQMDSSFLRVGTRKFSWPFGGRMSPEVITRVEAVDRKKDGSGGCAYLKAGGVGSRFVKLYLKTQRGGSLDFHITIYGGYTGF